MAEVVFYEKQGCANHRRQKDLLTESGHHLIVKDLLATEWTESTLLPFLKPHPVSAWFNRASPRVKSGEVTPEDMDAAAAIALLIADHLLIRRPLIQVGEWRTSGFDPFELRFLLSENVANAVDGGDFPPQSCHRKQACPSPQDPAVT